MLIKIGRSFEFETSGATFLRMGSFEMYLQRTAVFDWWPVVSREQARHMEVWFLGRHLTLG
jgi:hypothetical protein